MRTRYRIDDYQQSYFVIPSFEYLLKLTLETDFAPIYEEIALQPTLATDAIAPSDHVRHRGTQAHARRMAGEALEPVA